jgi:hypothetical protein
MKTLSLCALVACFLVGCTESDPYAKPPVAFRGEVDKRFVGTWKTSKGDATYDLKADGAYSLEARVSTPGGTLDTKSNGKWLVDKDRFLIEDAQKNVTPYAMQFEGSDKVTLTLTGTMKTETVLLRQPAAAGR